MSHQARVAIGYDFARRILASRKKFAAGDYFKEGLLNMNSKVIPSDVYVAKSCFGPKPLGGLKQVDPPNPLVYDHDETIPVDKMLPDHVIIRIHANSFKKLMDIHELNGLLLSKFDSQTEQLKTPSPSKYALLLKFASLLVIPVTAGQTSLYAGGFIKSIRDNGFVETLSKLSHKFSDEDDRKAKVDAEELKIKVGEIYDLAVKLDTLFSKKGQ